MKTTPENSESELLSRTDQPGRATDTATPTRSPRLSLKRRYANRSLPTVKLLGLLKTEAPRLYELAEVVGSWVWIAFEDKQPPDITFSLAEFGFHWNSRRQLWQHPCGQLPRRLAIDPRRYYGSHFPADTTPV